MSSCVMWQAASYARASKGNLDGHNTICGQQEQIRSYISAKHGIVLINEYADNGYSGVSFQRPGFQAMMEDIRAGSINCIVFRDLSRFGRNYLEVGKYLTQIFPFLAVRVISINDMYDSQYSDPQSSELLNAFKSLADDFYSRDISLKIRSQLDATQKW